jgi:hypothetical protein
VCGVVRVVVKERDSDVEACGIDRPAKGGLHCRHLREMLECKGVPKLGGEVGFAGQHEGDMVDMKATMRAHGSSEMR